VPPEVIVQPYWTPLHTQPPTFGGLPEVVLFEILLQRFTWGIYEWSPHPAAYDREAAARLWDESAAACGIDAL